MSGGKNKENQKRNCLFLVEADGLFDGRRRVRLPLQSPSMQGSSLLELKQNLADALDFTPAIDAATLEIELYNTTSQSFRRLTRTDEIPPSSCRIRIAEDSPKKNAMGNNSNGKTNTGPGDPSGELLALPWREFSSSIDLDGKLVLKGGKHSIAISEVSNSGLGTGTNIWDGAIALAKFLEFHDREDNDNDNDNNNDDDAYKSDDVNKSATISHDKNAVANPSSVPEKSYSVRGKQILELGAGTGLVGIAAHVAFGAHEVVLTDLEYSLDNLRNNIIANSCQDGAGRDFDSTSAAPARTIDARMLDWFDFHTCDAVLERPATEITALTPWYPDIVLAADVVWVESLVRPLVKTLHHICTRSLPQQQQEKPPPLILLSYQRRSQAVGDRLFRTLEEHSFRTEDVTSNTVSTTTGAESKIRIYEITYVRQDD